MTVQNIEVVGRLLTDAGRIVVQMEGTYDTDAADLWSALTERDRLARWFARVDGDFRLGGAFRAHLNDNDEDATGEIVVCEPPRRLHVTWRAGDDEETLIAVELIADGGRTRLVLQERGVAGARAADYGAGWHAHTDALGAYLTGTPPGDWHGRWRELVAAYRQKAEHLA